MEITLFLVSSCIPPFAKAVCMPTLTGWCAISKDHTPLHMICRHCSWSVFFVCVLGSKSGRTWWENTSLMAEQQVTINPMYSDILDLRTRQQWWLTSTFAHRSTSLSSELFFKPPLYLWTIVVPPLLLFHFLSLCYSFSSSDSSNSVIFFYFHSPQIF